MADWNSAQYLKFKAQRTQPALDLASRIDINPLEIIDIGCGPGNSTRVVKNRFPNARAVGADASENMLETARRDNPDCEFIRLDAGGDLSEFSGKFDLVFSNACIQWIPEHEVLLPKLFSMLKSGGELAVQVPVNFDEPIHQIIGRVSSSEKWREKLNLPQLFYTLTESEYFDILSDLTDDFEMWKTVYFHRMPSIDSIIEWYKSTGLKPYLEVLSDAEKTEFTNDVIRELEKAYPAQKNGEIIFRFPRLFFIAKRS